MKGISKAIVVLVLLAIVGVSGYFADRSNHQIPQYDPEAKQEAADKAAKAPPPPASDFLKDVYIYQPKPRHIVTIGYNWTDEMMLAPMPLHQIFGQFEGAFSHTNVQFQTQCLDIPVEARTNPGADKIRLGVYVDGKPATGLTGNPLIKPLMSKGPTLVETLTKGYKAPGPGFGSGPGPGLGH